MVGFTAQVSAAPTMAPPPLAAALDAAARGDVASLMLLGKVARDAGVGEQELLSLVRTRGIDTAPAQRITAALHAATLDGDGAALLRMLARGYGVSDVALAEIVKDRGIKLFVEPSIADVVEDWKVRGSAALSSLPPATLNRLGSAVSATLEVGGTVDDVADLAAPSDVIANRIMRVLKAAGAAGLRKSQIHAAFQRHIAGERLNAALAELAARGRIAMSKEATAGRSVERWRVIPDATREESVPVGEEGVPDGTAVELRPDASKEINDDDVLLLSLLIDGAHIPPANNDVAVAPKKAAPPERFDDALASMLVRPVDDKARLDAERAKLLSLLKSRVSIIPNALAT